MPDQRFGVTRLPTGELFAQRGRWGIAFAPRDGGGAHAFDFIEEFRRDLLGEQITHQRAEPTHIVAQGKIGVANTRLLRYSFIGNAHPLQAQSRRRLTQKD